jgi:hypothetical protein
MIKQSEAQTEQAARILHERLDNETRKGQTMERDLVSASEGLNQARRALQMAREQALAGVEQQGGGLGDGDAPPAYAG